MITVHNRLLYVCAVLFMGLTLVSCGGGGGGVAADGGGGEGTTGTLVVGLTDAPGDYSNIFVTIREVQVSRAAEGEEEEAEWLTILTPEETYDLMDLVNGTIQYLGATELDAGQYNQMRLILDEEKPADHPFANYLVIEGDEANPVELKVPSGLQTGIKLVNGFQIIASNTTELILDFDASKSIVQAGKSGNWHLKPTIKVVDTVNNSLEGIVTGEDDGLAEEGVAVSAQLAGTVESSALSGIDGYYFMYLPSGTYNLVSFKQGFEPACTVTDASPIGAHVEDIVLSPAAETGTFTGTVPLDGLAAADSAFFSVRQTVDCGAGDVEIELTSFNVAEDATSSEVVLPFGSYDIVVTAEGEETLEETITIESGSTDIDVVFPQSVP